MQHDYKYLIIGGGMVADSAAKGIRKVDSEGSIGIIGADADEPYTRPPLSKKLWLDADFSVDQLPLGTADETGAEVVSGTTVTSVDRAASTVTADNGDTYGYQELLLATGATPRTLDSMPPSDRVIYFRSLADYRALEKLASGETHIAVVGGGYIGTEIAAALALNSVKVTLIYTGDVLGGHMFPQDLAKKIESGFEEHQVSLRGGVKVESGVESGSGVELTLSDGSVVDADAVVFGLGVTPNGQLAEDAGLTVDDGIVVDKFLRTSDEHVYAAGDVANYPDAILGQQRAEHVDNARKMGETVGKIMAGSSDPYTYTPMFSSNMFDDGYQAVGTVSTDLSTIVDWKKPAKEGVVYYLDDSKIVRGVLMWNVSDAVDEAKKILADAQPQTSDSLTGKI